MVQMLVHQASPFLSAHATEEAVNPHGGARRTLRIEPSDHRRQPLAFVGEVPLRADYEVRIGWCVAPEGLDTEDRRPHQGRQYAANKRLRLWPISAGNLEGRGAVREHLSRVHPAPLAGARGLEPLQPLFDLPSL